MHTYTFDLYLNFKKYTFQKLAFFFFAKKIIPPMTSSMYSASLAHQGKSLFN